MSENMFAHPVTRGPVTRVVTGIGVTLAAIATIGLGAGAAAAAPQQPFAADDPIPGMPGAGSAVSIANSLFGSLSGLMNNVFPGAGDLLMPGGAGGGLAGLGGGLPGGAGGLPGLGGGLPGGLPGQAPGLGGYPGGLPGQAPGLGGYPGGLPGQAPGLSGYPGGLPGQAPGGLPGQQFAGQAPGVRGYPGNTVPGAPGQLGPAQAPLTGQPGPVASASSTASTLAHMPVV